MDSHQGPDPARISPNEPARLRFSVGDYHRLADIGLLARSGRTELIDGESMVMAPVGSPHIGAVMVLTRAFSISMIDLLVSVQSAIRLGDRSEPEPDLALLRPRADDYRQAPPPSAEDVVLVIEVSDTSLRYDLEVKLPLYASHGIKEAWVVDLAARTILVHRQPQDGRYKLVYIVYIGEDVTALALASVRISVANVV